MPVLLAGAFFLLLKAKLLGASRRFGALELAGTNLKQPEQLKAWQFEIIIKSGRLAHRLTRHCRPNRPRYHIVRGRGLRVPAYGLIFQTEPSIQEIIAPQAILEVHRSVGAIIVVFRNLFAISPAMYLGRDLFLSTQLAKWAGWIPSGPLRPILATLTSSSCTAIYSLSLSPCSA